MGVRLPTTEAVADLVRCIEASSLDGPALAAALSNSLNIPAILAHATLYADRYARVPLHVCSEFEIRLLCWRPGQSSTLHGHGPANGAMRVLSGTAHEIRLGQEDRQLVEGRIAIIEPDQVHQIANIGDQPLYTLHVYAPPLPVNQPSLEDGRRILIIGGGWCGAAVAIHLLAQATEDLRITLVERGPKLGRGTAYGTADPEHLLNVPAGRMGVDPDVPDAFLHYAREQGLPASPRSLLSRRLYGDYILRSLAKSVSQSAGKLRVVHADVQGVSKEQNKWSIKLSDGRLLPAEQLVLATGHGPPVVPAILRESGIPIHIGTDGALVQVEPKERLLILGSGLTAIDTLITLNGRQHEGPIYVLSLTGAWPHRHLDSLTWNGAPVEVDPEALPPTAKGAAIWFEELVQQAQKRGIPWQAVVDAVRPYLPEIWARFSSTERAHFLTHYRPEWERLRHRAPPAMLDLVYRLEAENKVQRIKGTLISLEKGGDAWQLQVGSAEAPQEIQVDRVILCTGNSGDIRTFDGPWPDLLSQGWAQADANHLGVVTNEKSQLVGQEGGVAGLWAVGGLLRARDFEATAVPELARQAKALAREILA